MTITIDRVVELRSVELLRSLREERKGSQAQLADDAGVTRALVSHWESGRRSRVTRAVALDVAAALRVPVDVLFMSPRESADDRPDSPALAG